MRGHGAAWLRTPRRALVGGVWLWVSGSRAQAGLAGAGGVLGAGQPGAGGAGGGGGGRGGYDGGGAAAAVVDYLDCADSSRTVRTVASIAGASMTLAEHYKNRDITIINSECLGALTLTLT